jgi:hypothetical protein
LCQSDEEHGFCVQDLRAKVPHPIKCWIESLSRGEDTGAGLLLLVLFIFGVGTRTTVPLIVRTDALRNMFPFYFINKFPTSHFIFLFRF